jgi:hypothetical protein
MKGHSALIGITHRGLYRRNLGCTDVGRSLGASRVRLQR